MKIKVLPVGNSPDYYEFNGDVVTAYKDGFAESFDFSALQVGDLVSEVVVETLALGSSHIFRNIQRLSSGEISMDICKAVGPGHWSVSNEFDSNVYDANAQYVKFDSTKPYAGVAWYLTKDGKVNV